MCYLTRLCAHHTMSILLKKTLIFYFVIGLAVSSVGQTIESSPLVKHYAANIEDLFSIWDIWTSPSGTLIFAGEHWLTEYDGHQFKKLFHGTVFSTAMNPTDSSIYIGTDINMSLLKRANGGGIKSQDLSKLLPDSVRATLIRHIVVGKRNVYFLGPTRVFAFDKRNGSIFSYDLKNQIRDGFAVGDSLYVSNSSDGLQNTLSK